jgi:hypothetical protein
MRSLNATRAAVGTAVAASVLSFTVALAARAQAPVTQAISYQGHLEKNNAAYDGVADFTFRLFDSEAAGSQIGGDLNFVGITVDGGIFNMTLDFGASAFAGEARWLEIAAKTTGDANFTVLTPRQPVRPAPYAVYALDGPGVSSPWTADGTGLVYSGGGVGVRGNTNFTQGNGVFFDGGYGPGTFAHVFAFDYDNFQPLTLLLNYPGGRVGVGTDYPEGRLQVNSSSEAAIIGKHTSNWVGVYGESQGSAGVWGNSISSVGVQGSSAGAYSCGVYGYSTNATGYGAIFRNTAGGAALWADGKAFVRSLEILGGADIVEGFDTGEHALEPGTVVVIDETHPGELRSSSRAYDTRVAGVVSGAGGIAPGLRLGQEGIMDGETPVAMSGRVYVRCSAEGGPIRPGDLLTTAARSGHAMRAGATADSHGAILGKAMGSLDHGTGLVLALVNLQ